MEIKGEESDERKFALLVLVTFQYFSNLHLKMKIEGGLCIIKRKSFERHKNQKKLRARINCI